MTTNYQTLVTSTVDVYNAATGIWSTASLSQARGGAAATSTGEVAYFGGGYASGGTESDRVNVYDARTDSWSTASLSQARVGLAAASAGGKVLFAGGWTGFDYVNRVDILDTTTGVWSTAALSQKRAYLAGASVGDRVLFAGGNGVDFYNTVDIYNTTTGVWSTSALSQGRNELAATTAGNKVFFAGGNYTAGGAHHMSDVVDIYTLQSYGTIESTKSWTLVDTTTVAGRMQLNSGSSLNLGGYDLSVGSMGWCGADQFIIAQADHRKRQHQRHLCWQHQRQWHTYQDR